MNDFDANNKKRSCGLIFGVFNDISLPDNESTVDYKFVLFENMIHLENQSPLSNTVQKDQY